MKKILGLILAACLFVFPALAEGFDLTAMSLDELQALYVEIKEEIDSRFPSSTFGIGFYVGGVNMKPGTYTFTCTDTRQLGNGDIVSGHIYVWRNDEEYVSKGYDGAVGHFYIRPGQVTTLYFAEGTTIELIDVYGEIAPSTGSWVMETP